MSLKQWQNHRNTWTAARDSAVLAKGGKGVSKGAVSGVNLGETIDGIAKAYVKGVAPLRAALAKLLVATGRYRAGIVKKSPALENWIKTNLEKDGKKLDDDLDATMKLYPTAAVRVKKAESAIRRLKPSSHFNDLKTAAEKNKQDWSTLVKQDLDAYAAAGKESEAAAAAVTTLIKGIKVEIPRSKMPKAELNLVAERIHDASKALSAVAKTKTYAQYSDAIVQAKGLFLPPDAPNQWSDWILAIAKEQG